MLMTRNSGIAFAFALAPAALGDPVAPVALDDPALVGENVPTTCTR
jgi:hypothetical protein